MQVGSIALIEVLVPLFVGIAFRTLLPHVAQRIREPIVRVAKSILSVACVAILVFTLPIVWVSSGSAPSRCTWPSPFSRSASATSWADRKNSIALAYACASRHPGVAISIATAAYLGKSFGAAVILLVVVQGIVCPLYVKWQRRRVAPAEAPPVAEPSPARSGDRTA